MVTQAGFNKFMIGETGQLKMWLDLLPEDMIRNNPVLLLFKAQLMPNSQQQEMVDTLNRVLDLSMQDNNLALYYDAASVLIYRENFILTASIKSGLSGLKIKASPLFLSNL